MIPKPILVHPQARSKATFDKILLLYGTDATNPEVLKYQAVLRGISLGGIKKFLAFTRAQFNSGFFDGCLIRKFSDGTVLNPVQDFEDLTTTHVVYMLIKDPVITGSKRMADCPEHIDPSDVGPPAYFISRESLSLSASQ